MSIEKKIREYKRGFRFFWWRVGKIWIYYWFREKTTSFWWKKPNSWKFSTWMHFTGLVDLWKKKDDKLIFKGTSDAIIVKGLVYIILEIFSNSTIEELKNVDMDIVKDLGLSEVITPNRQSGVIGMIKKIKEYALKA